MRNPATYRGARRNAQRAAGVVWQPFPVARTLRSFVGSMKGFYGRHIIRQEEIGDRAYELHATKGWRSYRNRPAA